MMAHYRQLGTTHNVKPRQTTAARGSALKPALNFKPRLALHGRGHISQPYMAGRVFLFGLPQRLRDGSPERPLDHQQPKLFVLLMQRQ